MAGSILGEAGMSGALDNKLVVSILAGYTIAQLSAMVPESCRVVRAMPNTPTRVCCSLDLHRPSSMVTLSGNRSARA